MVTHLVIFYTATAGANGPLLGSDEKDIVIMHYLVWDIMASKALMQHQYVVRPNSTDINENLLTDQGREDYGLTEERIKSGESLQSVVQSFQEVVSRVSRGEPYKVKLITDGQLHIRQVVHPKAVALGISLPDLYFSFFDLKKEFCQFYHPTEEIQNVTDMIKFLDLKSDTLGDLSTRTVVEMSKVIQRMTKGGHIFLTPEAVNSKLEPGICLRSEEVDSNCVVRARGLPWQSSDQDIAKFFRGLNIAKGGVALCLSPQGRRNGEALVRFTSTEHRDMALKRHKHHIANRYIEVYKASGEDFVSVAGGNNNEAQQFLAKGGQVIIRMRGLPYDCSAKQVVEFFESGESGCQIMDGEDGVLFVKKPDGRATGDAFVQFAYEDDCQNALAKHRELIGSRYIELFRSTSAEVQQVLNRSMDPKTYEQPQPLISQLPQIPIVPQQFITSGTRKDCIRLRGLPYEAQVEHILEFLGEHAKNIVFRGVHMVINAQGQPSGEAFIQMDSEQSAFLAAQQRHHQYMVFGKKHRYIEVFQCSGEDMNLVLSGGLPTQRAIASPGMLMWEPTGAASSLTQGASVPGLLQSGVPRATFPATALPSPFSTAITQNGSLIPAFQHQPHLKTDSHHFLLSSPLASSQVRPIIPQASLDIPHSSQSQSTTVLQTRQGVTSANSLNTAILTQYNDISLGAQGVAPIATPQGMLFLPGAKVAAYPPGMYSQFPFVAVSSAQGNQVLQSKYSMATSLLSVANAQSHAVVRPPIAAGSSGTKRHYEQAFSSDKSTGIGRIKRTNTQVTVSQLPSCVTAPRINTPQLSHNLTASHLTIPTPHLAQTPIGAAFIPTLYPPPQVYPPAM